MKLINDIDENILSFMEAIDKDFTPPLSSRGEIREYLLTMMRPLGFLLVKEADGRYIGVVGVQLEESGFDEPYIRFIAIHPDYRRGGLLYLSLFRQVEEEIARRGYGAAIARTWSTNSLMMKSLIRFVGAQEMYRVPNERGNGIDGVYFKWQVDAPTGTASEHRQS